MRRSVTLKCIKDSHEADFGDHGVDREGNPTGNRQALMRALSKRITVDVDGKEYVLPVFLVARVGQWFDPLGKPVPPSAIPDGDEWRAFEDDVVNREHSEEMLARWNKAQAKFIATSADAKRTAELQMEQLQSSDIAKSIQGLVRNVAQSTSRKASA
jgi:hypothetical protein